MSPWIRIKKTNKDTSIKVPPEGLVEGQSYLLQVSSGAHISIFEGSHIVLGQTIKNCYDS